MEEVKKCPYCGEEILSTAKKCKHCSEWLNNNTSDTQNPKSEKTTTLWGEISSHTKDEVTINGTTKISNLCQRWNIINSLFLMVPLLLMSFPDKVFGFSTLTICSIFGAILALFTLIYAIGSNTKTRKFALACSVLVVFSGEFSALLLFAIPLFVFTLIGILSNYKKQG